MDVFDMTQYSQIKEIFPELTNVQFKIALLYAMGVPHKEIAALQQISLACVKQTLSVVTEKFSAPSLSCLRGIFQVRLFLDSVQKINRSYAFINEFLATNHGIGSFRIKNGATVLLGP